MIIFMINSFVIVTLINYSIDNKNILNYLKNILFLFNLDEFIH